MFGHAAPGKDVADFSHGQHIQPCAGQGIQHGGGRRGQGEVMAAGCAAKVFGTGSLKGAGDDASHAVFSREHGTGRTAIFVQLFHRDHRFVGRYLKYGVRRRIDDQCSGAQVFFAVIPQHLGPGIRPVAQNTAAGDMLKFPNDFGREAVGVGGQRRGALHPGNLPVADGGVLSAGTFPQTGKGTDGGGVWQKHICTVQIKQPHAGQIGAVEILILSDGTQSVGAAVAKVSGVRRLSDAEGI